MWDESIAEILGCEFIDHGNMSSILVELFEGVVAPEVFLTHANKVAVQQIFSVRVSDSSPPPWVLPYIINLLTRRNAHSLKYHRWEDLKN